MSAASTALTQWPDVIMNTYGQPQVELVSGRGAQVVDSTGATYIDLLGGIAVNSLGHAHPAIISAVSEQIAQLGHVSNLFASAPVVEVAEELISRFAAGASGARAAGARAAGAGASGAGASADEIASETRVFFCNSGAEANEAAFKIARLTGRRRILSAVDSFHGRTMGALALTGQPDKREPFEPMPAGVEYFPYGNLDFLRAQVEVNPEQTAAIILEPIQGETGVIPAPEGFLVAVRELCDKHGILMIVDEVQTGIGRTGDFFAFQHERIIPDVVTMAKGLGGGLPIGACLAHGRAAGLLTPGKHGTTFGGNPVACAAAKAVLGVVDDAFCADVAAKGELLATRIAGTVPGVTQVRGRGLMLGVVFEQPVAKKLVELGLAGGLLLNAPNDHVVRLTPPLVITEDDIATAVERLATLAAQLPDTDEQ